MLIAVGTTRLLHYSSSPSSSPPSSQVPRLVADDHGLISMVVLSVNSARSSTIRNAQLTSDIVNALPAHSTILLMVPDREAFTVASNPWQDRVRFIDTPQSLDLTIWPQDPFLVIEKDDQPQLLVSRKFGRAGDEAMADVIAGHLQWPVLKSGLSFEGGNIVSDEEFIYIGANTIAYNAIELQTSQQEIVRQFQQELGRQVMVIGPLPQPIGHIDMMLTPLGERHLLLADPGWGASLVSQDLSQQPEQVRRFEQRSMDVFFGHPDIRQLVDPTGEVIKPPEIIGASEQAIADSEQLGLILDELAESLRQTGFKVDRIPYFSQLAKLPETADDAINRKPGYPQITYNNVLIETTPESKHVYLPGYGWPALDQAAKRVWQNLGYEVSVIGGFTTTVMYGGALRCSVKVLTRSVPD